MNSKKFLEELEFPNENNLGDLVETPFQNLIPESAVIRSMDNLISTYGEIFVIDTILSAYIIGRDK